MKSPKSSLSVFVHCKQLKTGGGNALGMRLAGMPWERDLQECPGNKTGGNVLGTRLAGMAWERDLQEWPGNETESRQCAWRSDVKLL